MSRIITNSLQENPINTSVYRSELAALKLKKVTIEIIGSINDIPEVLRARVGFSNLCFYIFSKDDTDFAVRNRPPWFLIFA